MPASPDPAISIRNLRKTFGPKVAVDNLDLVVPTGSLCGFIGPNGAGKTTTIRMIMSILFPDSGELSVLGKASAVESKDRIGYLPEERGIYRKMRVLSFLVYIARLKGIDAAPARRAAADWLERVELGPVGKKRCEELSKGMQQKVQFIAAVIHKPDLLVLDEVFTGLDPVNRRLMRDLIHEQHQGGRTVVFSTHAMYEAEQLCDRIFMIHRGVKMLDDTLDGIRARFDPKTILVEPRGLGIPAQGGLGIPAERGLGIPAQGSAPETLNAHDTESLLRSLPGVAHVERDGESFTVGAADGAEPSRLMAAIAAAVPLRRIELKRVNLEDVFIDIVTAKGDTVQREALRQTPTDADQEAAVV